MNLNLIVKLNLKLIQVFPKILNSTKLAFVTLRYSNEKTLLPVGNSNIFTSVVSKISKYKVFYMRNKTQNIISRSLFSTDNYIENYIELVYIEMLLLNTA